MHVTRNGGKTWTNVTPKDMPEFGRVSQIDASAFNDGGAYISVRRPLLNDRAPYIWKTADYGRTWTKIVNGLAADEYVHAVREDPTRRGLLYAATQHGVHISYDDGATWQSLALNMPDIPVADIVVEGNELVIASHGRGFWALDNIAPLRQVSPAVLASDNYLFASPVGVRSGAAVAISWKLKKAPTNVKLEILDSMGTVLRTFVPDTVRSDTAGAPPGTTSRWRAVHFEGSRFTAHQLGSSLAGHHELSRNDLLGRRHQRPRRSARALHRASRRRRYDADDAAQSRAQPAAH